MKKSLSLILSIALVFSMFSSLAFAADQSIGEKLKAAGVISGNSSGDLMEDQIWKREDLTVLAAKLLGVVEEAQAAGDTHDFDDVDNPYYDGFISYAKENGIFVGVSETSFGMNRGITAKQFAAVILRLLGFEFDYDTETEALAIEHGIFAEGTNWLQPAKRGDLYSALAAGIQVVGADGKTIAEKRQYAGFYEVSNHAIKSFKAVGAKKLEVKMATAVDTDKAKVAVNRGNFPSNIKEVTWSADKTTATIETVATLQKGDYTVTVTGVTEDALTATTSVEAERVAAININNTKAPLVDNTNTSFYVFFNLVNQYNEDVTSSKMGGLTFNISRGTAGTSPAYADGKLTVNAVGTDKFNIGDKVIFSVTYIGGTDSAFASETLEISPIARVQTIDFTELYSKDNKELNNKSTLTNFGVLVDAKDQYGNAVSVRQLNDDVSVQVAGNSVAITTPAFVASAGGSDKIGVQLDTPAGGLVAGTSSLFAVSTASGDSSRFEITVAEAPTLHSLKLFAPELAVAGETVEIPFEAVDQFGNVIEDEASILDGLNNRRLNATSVGGVTPGIAFKTNYVNDKVTLELDTRGITTANATTVIISGNTNRISQDAFISLSVALQPNAKPEVITKVEGITGALAVGGKTTIEPGNVKIVDQYGRIKDAAFFSGYTVSVATSDSGKVSASGTNLSSNVVLSGAAEGSSDITLKVDTVNNSDLSFKVRVVKKDAIVSYETNDIATLYAGGSSYTRDLTVQGVLEDGTKVAVPNLPEYYSVTSSVYGLNVTNHADKVVLYADSSIDVADNAEGTFAIVVVGSRKDNQQPIVKEITVSKKKPVVTTWDVRDGSGVYDSAKKQAEAYISISERQLTSDSVINLARNVVKAVDQYGYTMEGQITNAFANVSDITEVQPGKDFTVTVVFQNSKVFEFKVRVTN